MTVWHSWAPGWAVVQLVAFCLSLDHWSTKVEQTETAQPKAAAIQLTFMLAVPLFSPYVHFTCLGKKI